ncbi:MAG: serine hydrolase domain-containing protein [Chitinophagales bacterium]
MNRDDQACVFLDNLVKKHKSPGLQYLLILNGATRFVKQAGYSEFESGKMVTQKSSFNACSVTKTFTSLAVMQLVEQGKLKLSDNLADFFPDYPFSTEITIQQLLSHTSGLPNPIPLRWAHLQEEDADFNFDEFISTVLKAHSRLKSKPGEKFKYSNLNYLALGKIIEKISGTSYKQYIRENIFSKINPGEYPLDFQVPDESNYARGYQKRFSFFTLILGLFLDKKKFTEPSSNKRWLRFRKYYVNGTSYGGLIANAHSLSEFIQCLFKEGSVLLSDEYKRILLTRRQIASGKKAEMTLGWFTGKLGGNDYFTHAGAGGGYYCEMRIYPGLNMISAIMFNRSGMNDERFLDKIDHYFI